MREDLIEGIINCQERMLYGCSEIFRGLRSSSDPDVVFVSEQALEALQQGRDIMDALIESTNQTKH